MQATIKSGTRSRLKSAALGLGSGLGRSARGHQQEGQRDHADHEGQDDGEHEVADDPRIDRGEPGGERLVVQDVAVPGDRDRRSTDGDHEVGGGTEQRRAAPQHQERPAQQQPEAAHLQQALRVGEDVEIGVAGEAPGRELVHADRSGAGDRLASPV